MGKVVFNMSMSLDGFVAGPNDEVDRLFKWYFSGDTDFQFPGSNMVFKVSPASAEYFREGLPSIGAIVYGRRTFDVSQAWGGNPPLGVPCIIMTHKPPQEWIKAGSPFTFVTDGVESAIRQAKAIAGDKDVAVGSATTMQQCIKAGLLDEIHIDLAPVLLGDGVRLFEHLKTEPIELEITRVIEGTGVTHLIYRIAR